MAIMFEASETGLPVQLACRLLLDDVSYSNALPDWFDVLTINYVERENRIRKSIAEYLKGTLPADPYTIDVPKRNGKSNTWVLPSVNDQIICQACVSAVAETIERKSVDRTRVFSCRLNRDAGRLAFLEDQVTAWSLFQAELQSRCGSDNCILQIDIKNAFESIKLDLFEAFIDRAGVDATARQLLKSLIKSFSKGASGLPFLNDSIFFLGSAYFSEVDAIVSRHTRNFIRFADDYKIFGADRSSLETIASAIRTELASLGLEISDTKVWLGSGQEYLQAASKLTFAQTEGSSYVDSLAQPGVLRPADILAQLRMCLEKPDDYLHQGFGRYQMAAIRRMRVRGLYSDAKGFGTSPADQFAGLLAQDNDAIGRICDLLKSYSAENKNSWRLIWLLYLCKSLERTTIANSVVGNRLLLILRDIANASPATATVDQLWATTMKKLPNGNAIEDLHQLGYIDEGRGCCGI
jgi:hypothetical protein